MREPRVRGGAARTPAADSLQRLVRALTEGLSRDLAAFARQAIVDEIVRIDEDTRCAGLHAPASRIHVTHAFGWDLDPREPLVSSHAIAAHLGLEPEKVGRWFRARGIDRFATGRTARGYPVRLYRWRDLASALDRDRRPRWVSRDRTPGPAHVEPPDPETIEEARWLRESLATLEPRTALVMVRLFVHERTLAEIAEEIGVSGERARKVAMSGVGKLRMDYIRRLRGLWARDAPSVPWSLAEAFRTPEPPAPETVAPLVTPPTIDEGLAFALDDLVTARRPPGTPAFGTVVVGAPWPWAPRTPAEVVFERPEDVADPRLVPVGPWAEVRRIGNEGSPSTASERIARINETFRPRRGASAPQRMRTG